MSDTETTQTRRIKPLEEVDRQIYALLHRLWGKGHDAPGYDKAEWSEFSRLIDMILRRQQ